MIFGYKLVKKKYKREVGCHFQVDNNGGDPVDYYNYDCALTKDGKTCCGEENCPVCGFKKIYEEEER